ncbi:MAG: DUF1203 domain-containing protein [Lewinellaceae bacterium]|nr:DUF1203 domain-containing protein [Lewinellaceae bacterium]
MSLEDVEIGEEVILFPLRTPPGCFTLPVERASLYPESSPAGATRKNTLPKMLEHRLLSLRVYDANGMMVNARTVEGRILHDTVQGLFQNKRARYMQVHNAGSDVLIVR